MIKFRRGHPQRWPWEKAPMTDDRLAKEPHELSAKQKRKRSDEIMATALKRLERKDA